VKNFYILKTGTTFPSILAEHGDFDQWTVNGLETGGKRCRVVNVEGGAGLPDPGDCLAVVITGSHAMVTDDLPWSLEIEKWLPGLLRAEVPLLAICYGHQLLARALGGRVGYHPRGIETGTVEIRLEPEAAGDPLFASMPVRFPANVDHSQSLIELPPGSVRLAVSPHEPCHAFRVGSCAWGVQFHPEFTATIMRLYILAQEARLRDEGHDADALLAGIRETPVAGSILKRFALIAGLA